MSVTVFGPRRGPLQHDATGISMPPGRLSTVELGFKGLGEEFLGRGLTHGRFKRVEDD
jgi:hypothetical protein